MLALSFQDLKMEADAYMALPLLLLPCRQRYRQYVVEDNLPDQGAVGESGLRR